MSAPARLAAFALALVAVFGGGWALGSVVADEPSDPDVPARTIATSTTVVSTTAAPHDGAHGSSGHEGS